MFLQIIQGRGKIMGDKQPDSSDKALPKAEKPQEDGKGTLWENIKRTRPHPPYRPSGDGKKGYERE
jgi:hypothetical protein